MGVEIKECGLPGGTLGDALAFIAAAGLNSTEANWVLAPFGLRVTGLERRYGYVALSLSDGSFYAIPIVLEAQGPAWGRLVVVNPSNVSLSWVVEYRLENNNGGQTASGAKAASYSLTAAPRSASSLYLYGLAKDEGMYQFGYRLYVSGTYRWGNLTFVLDRRLVTQNGSILNWLWGALEGTAGWITGDKCMQARGEGRRWAAESIGLAGVATELDVAAGGAALVFTMGESFVIRAEAKTAAEAISAGEKLAGAYKVPKILNLASLLANGALLGWDAYFDVANGEIPFDALASTAAYVGGVVSSKARIVLAAASSGMLFLYFGQDSLDLHEFAQELNSTASKYGEYSQCFIDGALGAFDVYSKEVLAANFVGLASAVVDINSILNNKAFKGYLSLAAHSAFNYKVPFPIFKVQAKNKDIILSIGKYKIGQIGRDKFKIYRLVVDNNNLKIKDENPGMVENKYSTGPFHFKFVWRGEEAMKAVVVSSKKGGTLAVGYNDMLLGLSVAKVTTGDVFELDDTFSVGGYNAKVLKVKYQAPDGLYQFFEGQREMLYKYLTGGISYGLYGVHPASVGMKVTVPVPDDQTGQIYQIVRIGSNIPSYASGLTPNAMAIHIPLSSSGRRFDLFGVLDDGKLLIVEVKNLQYMSSPSDMELPDIAYRVKALREAVNQMSKLGVNPYDFISALVAAFNGAGTQGTFVANVFSAQPRFTRGIWRDSDTPVLFSLVLAKRDEMVVLKFDLTLSALENTQFLEELQQKAFYYQPSGKIINSVKIDDIVKNAATAYSQFAPPDLMDIFK